jgi:hypothetical protein
MTSNAGRIKVNAFQINDVLLNTIDKMKSALGLAMILKGIDLSYSGYIRLRNKVACQLSMLPFCRAKHSGQLLSKEVDIIKKYCAEERFIHWPLASVFHQIIRDKAAFFSLHTFYKYTSLLNIRRPFANHRRKNHTRGIRTERPLQIFHADSTIFRTADGQKNYIHLIQDNHSRAILGFKVSRECSAKNMFEILSEVADKYLKPSDRQSCILLTDDGSENAGEVTSFIARSENPTIRHLIAQRDISFSNSMIEAANKQLKYRFLYHKQIYDFFALLNYIVEAIEDYNNRPHDVLNGLTPLEVLDGMRFDPKPYRQQIAAAKVTRTTQNKKTRCCCTGF